MNFYGDEREIYLTTMHELGTLHACHSEIDGPLTVCCLKAFLICIHEQDVRPLRFVRFTDGGPGWNQLATAGNYRPSVRKYPRPRSHRIMRNIKPQPHGLLVKIHE